MPFWLQASSSPFLTLMPTATHPGDRRASSVQLLVSCGAPFFLHQAKNRELVALSLFIYIYIYLIHGEY